MSHCVPNGEVDFEDFDTFSPGFMNDLLAVKSKWVMMQHTKKSMQDDMAFVPDHDFVDPAWGDVSLPVQSSGNLAVKPVKQQWQQVQGKDWQLQSKECEWISAHHTDGVIPSMPIGLDRVDDDNGEGHHQAEQPAVATNFKEDELESWLQYPLDEMDHPYGHDMWDDLQPSSPKEANPTHSNPGPQVLHGTNTSKAPPSTVPGFQASSTQSARAASAAAALALGAQRAAGLIPPASDPFNKVRASSLPTITTSNVRWGSGASVKAPVTNHISSHVGTLDALRELNASRGGQVLPPFSSPKMSAQVERCIQQGAFDWSHLQGAADRGQQQVQPQQQVQGTMGPPGVNRNALLNFSHFSRPAAKYSRANLQNMGVALCGVDELRVAGLSGSGARTSSLSCTSSVAESTLVGSAVSAGGMTAHIRSAVGGGYEDVPTSSDKVQSQDINVSLAGEKRLQKTGTLLPSHGGTHLVPLPLEKRRSADVTEYHTSTITSGGAAALEKSGELHRRGSLETTVTSSCAAESSGPPSKSDSRQNKGKRSRDEETEYGQSEDAVEESADVKKSGTSRGGASAAKRSRAAEVHNLSERRRRDRINERMKALQELIPNSNKTDKASMLDEAIEYLKMLQLQLQVMSMRTGIGMGPLLPGQMLPGQNMPQLPMAGLPGLPPIPAGMAMPGMAGMPGGMPPMGNMGMNLPGPPMSFGDVGTMSSSLPPQHQRHLMDLAAAYPQGRMSGQAPAPRHAPSSAVGSMDGAHPRQLATQPVDPLGAYLARQQQQQQMHAQTSQTPVNLDVYQAYLLQHQQQQQSKHQSLLKRSHQ